MARTPRPSKIQIGLRGDTGSHRKGTIEPQAPPGAPKCPDHLTGIAKAEWVDVCSQLDKLQLLSTVDAKSIELYCSCYQRYREAEQLVKANGSTYETGVGTRKHTPEYLQLRQETTDLRKYLTMFGLNPAARASMRVKVDEKPDEGWGNILKVS